MCDEIGLPMYSEQDISAASYMDVVQPPALMAIASKTKTGLKQASQ